MARITSRFASLAAIAAVVSLAATPASAHEWHRHHGGVSVGDVFAGALIIGGIAAIASAASKSNRDREIREDYRYRYRDPEPVPNSQPVPYPQERYDYQAPAQSRDYQAGGINDAVNGCVGEVERGDAHVASIDNASRSEDGWRITGQLDSGGGFNCLTGNDGRVRQVDFGGDRASSDEPQNGQWDDTDYANARQADAGDQDDGYSDDSYAGDGADSEPAYDN